MFEIKQSLDRRDVGQIADPSRTSALNPTDVPAVAARYLNASVREALAERGVSYVDATGNIRIAIDEPAMFMSDRGEDRDPWRRGRPLGTLKGQPAARVTRALLDYRRDWSVRELVTASGASTGGTYRVLEHLSREDLVTKDSTRYRVTDWERLLREWSNDAPFHVTSRAMSFIEPRGVETFLRKLADDPPFALALTGSMAAQEWVTYAPAKVAQVYVASIEQAAEHWGLRANSAAPNVILLEPSSTDDVPFVNTVRSQAGHTVAAPPQVAADLLNGPGRQPAEGDHLIQWLQTHEAQWRRD
ncbi:hypothetical protein ACSDQ9_05035 [Aestuariimicrobium soli]|uniref:hypothetical protein n=1 Tax=Aestuariimicrobium soli TaxID=2035834 RepID=UPI003EB6DF50